MHIFVPNIIRLTVKNISQSAINTTLLELCISGVKITFQNNQVKEFKSDNLPSPKFALQ